MLKILVLNFILLFPLNQASCLRYDLIESYADSFHECIRTQKRIPLEFIQKKIRFYGRRK